MARHSAKSRVFSRRETLLSVLQTAQRQARDAAKQTTSMTELEGRFSAHHREVLGALQLARRQRWRYVMRGYWRIAALRAGRRLVAVKVWLLYLVTLFWILIKIGLLIAIVLAIGWLLIRVGLSVLGFVLRGLIAWLTGG